MNFTLRKWTKADLGSLMKHANNINIAKNLTDAFPHPYTILSAEAYLNIANGMNPAGIFAIDVNGEAVGSIGIYQQTDIHAMNAEMGYWLSEDYWGQGIMTGAIKEMVRYGFDTFDITRIFARPFGTNNASQRVLEKAGFTLEAHFEKTLLKNGEFVDELVYGIRKDNL